MQKKVSLVLAGLLLVFPGPLHANEVEAEGRSAEGGPNAREEALTDALREAVRVGVGVDILSSTVVKNFSLEFDRVLTASFGYVKNYRVLSSGMGKDGIYRLKVRAEVSSGTPGMNGVLALKQIVLLKQSPRVALEIDENVDGIPQSKGYAVSWFEQAAQQMQLQLVDLAAVHTADSKRAARDEILGENVSGKFRRADISQKADFIIQGKVNGRYVGEQSIYGSSPQHQFELGSELRAIRPDTGEVVASIVLPASESFDSDLQSKEMAAREVMFKMLDGRNADRSSGAWRIFTKIFARWMTEIDMGALKRIEFSKISSDDFQKVQNGLRGSEKISAVWQREYDSEAGSILDVETRLTAAELTTRVEQSLGDHVQLDRATGNYLQFSPKKGASNGTPKPKTILERLFGK